MCTACACYVFTTHIGSLPGMCVHYVCAYCVHSVCVRNLCDIIISYTYDVISIAWSRYNLFAFVRQRVHAAGEPRWYALSVSVSRSLCLSASLSLSACACVCVPLCGVCGGVGEGDEGGDMAAAFGSAVLALTRTAHVRPWCAWLHSFCRRRGPSGSWCEGPPAVDAAPGHRAAQ